MLSKILVFTWKCVACVDDTRQVLRGSEKVENRCLSRWALHCSLVFTDVCSVGRRALCAPKIFKFLNLGSLCDQRYAFSSGGGGGGGGGKKKKRKKAVWEPRGLNPIFPN
jgi:hypothetical protein